MRGLGERRGVAGGHRGLDPFEVAGGGVQERLHQLRYQRRAARRVELAQRVDGLDVDDRRLGQRRLRLPGRRHRVGAFLQPAGERAAQRTDRVRLGEEAVHAGLQAGLLVARHGVGRERDDRHAGLARVRKGTDGGGGLKAIHHRHLAVHQHQVEARIAHLRHRLGTVDGQHPFLAKLVQHGGGDALIDRVVLHQQHPTQQFPDRRRGVRRRRGAVHRLALQHGCQHAPQLGAPHGLAELRHDARRGTRLGIDVRVTGGEPDQPRLALRRVAGDQLGQHQAVHLRQVHVHQHQIKGPTGARRVGQRGLGAQAVVDPLHVHLPGVQLLAQDLATGAVVFHDQHALVGQHRLGRRRRGRRLRPRQVQVDDEVGALAGRAVDADAAAHQPKQAPADGEPEPGAAELARGGAVGLGEVLEDALLRLGRDAGAGVLHADLHRGAGVGFLTQRDAHQHLAAGGELDGVAEQVGHHLAQAEGVAAQRERRLRRHELHQQVQTLGLRRLREHRGGFFHHLAEVQIRHLGRELARFDLGEIEDVVDHAEQVAPGAAHRQRPFALLRLQLALDQQLVHAEHAVHRRANLVAHGGEELALGLTGRLGRLLGQHELRGAPVHLVFQARPLRLKAPVAFVDLLQHGVETVAERGQFRDRAGRRAQAVIAGLRHLPHELAKLAERPEHAPVQAPQQHPADSERQRARQRDGQQQAERLLVDGTQADGQHQAAAGAAARAIVNGLFDGQATRAEQALAGGRVVQLRRRLAGAQIGGEQPTVGAVQRRHDDIRREAQEIERPRGRVPILVAERREGVL